MVYIKPLLDPQEILATLKKGIRPGVPSFFRLRTQLPAAGRSRFVSSGNVPPGHAAHRMRGGRFRHLRAHPDRWRPAAGQFNREPSSDAGAVGPMVPRCRGLMPQPFARSFITASQRYT